MLLAEVQYQKSGTFVRTLKFLHDENGAVIGISVKNVGETSFTSYYYAKNLQGDVVAVYRSDYNSTTQTYYPTLVVSYEYDPWGKVTRVKGSPGAILSLEAYPNHIAHVNPIRYRGYYYDNETGFYYLQSRYYDPVISRFINADEYASTGLGFLGTNMFAYCTNNPITYSDPTGEFAISTIIFAVSVVVGVACAGYTAYKEIKAGLEPGQIVGDTIFAGLSGFTVAYSFGTMAFQCYQNYCYLNSLTSATELETKNCETTCTALQTYYPPNDGFLGTPQNSTLQPGTMLQKTGHLYGSFVAPAGTPYQMLSLPYDKIGQPTIILQVEQPIPVLSGTVAPWFGQMGGGMQYVLNSSVQELVNTGALTIVRP